MTYKFTDTLKKEIAKLDDEGLFALLGELIQPSTDLSIEWDDHVYDELEPVGTAYNEAYGSIAYRLENGRKCPMTGNPLKRGDTGLDGDARIGVSS